MTEEKGRPGPQRGEALDDPLMLLLPQEAGSRAPVPEGDASSRGEPVRGDGGGGDREGGHSGESRQGRGCLLPSILRPLGATGLAQTHTHTHTHTQIQPFLRGYINFVSSVPTQDTIKDPPLLPTLPDPAPH